MKRFLCAMLIAVMALLVSGCNDTSAGKPNSPFEIVEQQGKYQIWKHKETGVYYFWYTYSGYQGGLTVMLNSDGTPYTGEWEGEIDGK